MVNNGMPTEEDADNAIKHFLLTMPKVSKEVDSLSKKELKRILLSLLKHPIEAVIVREEKEIDLLNLMLSILNANMLALAYAAELKHNELEAARTAGEKQNG